MINVFTDLDGKPILIYVSVRTVDSPVYYNLVQKYSSATQATTRIPDADGYYVYDMAVNGGVNAALLAAQILAVSDDDLAKKLDDARVDMAKAIAEKEAKLQQELH